MNRRHMRVRPIDVRNGDYRLESLAYSLRDSLVIKSQPRARPVCLLRERELVAGTQPEHAWPR
jgi:hypothetical protein